MGTELFFKMGSFYRISERTGFATRAENTKREWQGLFVEKRVFEPRQPQDFVRGVPDIQTVPYSRPRPADVFIKTSQNASFEVLGGSALGTSFNVQNGQFQVYAGTVPTVNPANFPSSF